eukprot:196749_1
MYSAFKVKDLKTALEERGLNTVGKKNELIARLEEADGAVIDDGESAMADVEETVEAETTETAEMGTEVEGAGEAEAEATTVEVQKVEAKVVVDVHPVPEVTTPLPTTQN